MGLGSLVELVPVMENDCHFGVFKSDYSEDTNVLRLTDSDSNTVNMLTGCFADKNCGSLNNVKSSFVAKELSDDFNEDLEFGNNAQETKKSLIQEDVIPLGSSRLKIDEVEDALVARAVSLNQNSKNETNDSITPKKAVESLSEKKVFLDKDHKKFQVHDDECSKQCGTYNEMRTLGSLETSKTYQPLTISVLDSNRRLCSLSGNDTHRGLMRKSFPNFASLPCYEKQKGSKTSGSGSTLLSQNVQALNKTLDSFKVSSAEASARSSLPSPGSMKTSTCTSTGKKEVAKRKTMQERLIRLPRLFTTCPQLEHAPAMHWAMLLRRFKKYYPVSEYISEEVIQHVLNEKSTFSKSEETIQNEDLMDGLPTRLRFHPMKTVNDPYATESSSEDDDNLPGPSTSRENRPHISKESATYRYLKEQVEICAQDIQAARIIEDCDRSIEAVKQELEALRGRKCSVILDPDCCGFDEGGGSARCRPYNKHIRRKLVKFSERNCFDEDFFATSLDAAERVRCYGHIDDRINPGLSLLKAVPLERRMQTYIKRRASRPLKFSQQRSDCPTWRSKINLRSPEDWEGCSVQKDVFDQNSEGSRTRERSTLRKARRNNHSNKTVSPLKRAGKRLVKRSLDHKRNGERYSNSRSRARHLERRKDAHFLPRIFREFNGDESSIQDVGLPGLPQKIDYKEICIPPWKYSPLNLSEKAVDNPCSHIAEAATPAEISRRHLPLELNERKRFQQYRDFVASKSAVVPGVLVPESKVSKLPAVGTSSKLIAAERLDNSSVAGTASSVCSRAQSPTASLDDDKHSFVVDPLATPEYDRPSIATPYTPRHFPLSSPILSASP
uniref:DNA helicase n=1 Tax=Syphacia muris TaxID=451379 RepID=A0A0N5AH67_9BILA